VDGCSFLTIELRALPMLERHAWATPWSSAFSMQSSGGHDALGCFLENAPIVDSLAVRFAGSKRWIAPRLLSTRTCGA